MQETFLKLLTHLEAGGHTANLRGWLFTVAANACRDRMRRRLRWLPWTPANEPSVDPAPLPDEDGRLRAARRCAAAARAPRSASPHAQSAGTVLSRNLDRRPDTRVVRGPPAGARRGPLGAGHPWPPPLFRTLQEIVMKCLDDAQVQALVDNEAADDVRAHAASCARCAARIEKRRTVIDACPAGAGHSSTDGRHAAAARRTGRRGLLGARRDPAARDWRASRPVAPCCLERRRGHGGDARGRAHRRADGQGPRDRLGGRDSGQIRESAGAERPARESSSSSTSSSSTGCPAR